MTGFLASRALSLAFVLWLVTVIAFVVIRLAPGDPSAIMLGSDATPKAVAEFRAKYGLDRPIAVQYVAWLGRVVRGDLGTSIYLGRPVTTAILERLPVSLTLTLAAFLIAVVLGGGFVEPWVDPPASLRHLLLPAFALGYLQAGLIARMTRTSMLEALRGDFVRTARSKGVAELRVVVKHAFRNALIPVLTVSGIALAVLFGGAVVIETVFTLPGVGRLLVNAVVRRDYAVVQGTLLLVALWYVLVNMAVDFLYTVSDPRVRLRAS
ncbi:MAG: peptide ABC transporter [Candidatus Rokuibacteriota bacterium]|nr:MAG: peptide ABC transporter [Candidatus Rokubacteria bacterium]